MTKLIAWFVKAALRHADAMEALQEENAREQVACLDRFYTALKGEHGLERFLELLDDENPAVCGMAAVYAMREAPEQCSAVLERLSKKPGLMGFRAQAALDLWKSGEWPR